MQNTHSTLTSLFTDIADAIREKDGSSTPKVADAFPAAIRAIPSGGTYVNTTATTLGENALRDCGVITECEYTACTYVEKAAFRGCANLKSISLPVCNNFGDFFCRECTSLETISLPVATAITYGGFYKCVGIKSIDNNMLPIVTNIGKQAFEYCTGIESINLTGSVTLGQQAFRGCTGITIARFESVNFAGSNVFNGCSSLTDLYITGNTVSTMGDYSALANTPIWDRVGYIHVPANLVSAYKSANQWSAYNTQIVAI